MIIDIGTNSIREIPSGFIWKKVHTSSPPINDSQLVLRTIHEARKFHFDDIVGYIWLYQENAGLRKMPIKKILRIIFELRDMGLIEIEDI